MEGAVFIKSRATGDVPRGSAIVQMVFLQFINDMIDSPCLMTPLLDSGQMTAYSTVTLTWLLILGRWEGVMGVSTESRYIVPTVLRTS